MKFYPPKEGLSAWELKSGQWSLYADVKCTNPECRKEYSLANVGLGGPCKKCGERCL